MLEIVLTLSESLKLTNSYLLNINLLSDNPTKWSNTLKQKQKTDELFECVWPFCEFRF